MAEHVPDLGLAYVRDGHGGRGVRVYFYHVPFDAIQFIKPNSCSLMLHYLYCGAVHALSLDFDAEVCAQLLAKLDGAELGEFTARTAEMEFPCTVPLPRVITATAVECSLGDLQRSAAGEFVPFVVHSID